MHGFLFMNLCLPMEYKKYIRTGAYFCLAARGIASMKKKIEKEKQNHARFLFRSAAAAESWF